MGELHLHEFSPSERHREILSRRSELRERAFVGTRVLSRLGVRSLIFMRHYFLLRTRRYTYGTHQHLYPCVYLFRIGLLVGDEREKPRNTEEEEEDEEDILNICIYVHMRVSIIYIYIN